MIKKVDIETHRHTDWIQKDLMKYRNFYHSLTIVGYLCYKPSPYEAIMHLFYIEYTTAF